MTPEQLKERIDKNSHDQVGEYVVSPFMAVSDFKSLIADVCDAFMVDADVFEDPAGMYHELKRIDKKAKEFKEALK